MLAWEHADVGVLGAEGGKPGDGDAGIDEIDALQPASTKERQDPVANRRPSEGQRSHVGHAWITRIGRD